MVVSGINPNDASAMQEDVNQVLKGMLQLMEIALERQDQQQANEAKPQIEDLRIQMGRQVVYGQMSREFRSELTPERMEILQEAFQQPVAQGVDRSDYERRIPAIEVKQGEETLFRQERDGVISVNQFDQLQEQLSQQPGLDPRAEVLKNTAHAALATGGVELSQDKTVVVASEAIGADYPDGFRILAKRSENGSLEVFQLDPVTIPDQPEEYSKSPADTTPVLTADGSGKITYFDEKHADIAIAELTIAAQGIDQQARRQAYYHSMDIENVDDLEDIDARYDPAEADDLIIDMDQEPVNRYQSESIVENSERLLQYSLPEQQKLIFGEYSVDKEGELLRVFRDNQLIIQAKGDQIENLAARVEDQHAFVMIADEVLERDTDADGLSDIEERANGTNPLGVDSDADGLTDTQEISLGTDPLTIDSDGDGTTDAEELRSGTNPTTEQTYSTAIHSPSETANSQRQDTSVAIGLAAASSAVADSTQPELETESKEGVSEQTAQQKEEKHPSIQNGTTPQNDASLPPLSTPEKQAQASIGKQASLHQSESAPQPSGVEIPAAVRIAAQEVKNLPDGNAKQLFKALVVELGKQSQQVGQQALDWVASRPEWKRNQDVAHTAKKLFDQHYKQTGETTYQAENYNIKLKGTHNYEVSDLKGKKLMTFEKASFGRLKVLQSSMTSPQYNDFHHARQTTNLGNLAPRGTREAAQVVKTQEVLKTAQQFLQNMGVRSWNPGEKGNYSVEGNGSDYLKIDSKADGRGTILKLEEGQLTANLQSKDFSFFRKVDQTMNQLLQEKVEQTHSKQQVQAKPKERAMVIA